MNYLDAYAKTLNEIRLIQGQAMAELSGSSEMQHLAELQTNQKYVSIEVAEGILKDAAIQIEKIKDEKNIKIEALQLAILTIYKPETERLESKIQAFEKWLALGTPFSSAQFDHKKVLEEYRATFKQNFRRK
jgi:hypothetical protein